MKKNYFKFSLIFTFAIVLLLDFVPVSRNERESTSVSSAFPPSIELEAKAALAEDFLTGEILFSRNQKEILPLASLTKIIAALVLLDGVDLREEIKISKEAVLIPEPSPLKIGEYLKAEDLVAMIMVESSNDAIYALFEHFYQKNNILPEFAEQWFLDLMRQKSNALGARSMIFNNFIGLDVSETLSGAYGSAEDLMKIARYSLDSPIWQFESLREIASGRGARILKPTNELKPDITSVIGAKTGYTDLAGGNLLVIVEYPVGRPIGIVVLGSSEKGRFSDVKKILGWIKARSPLPTLPL